MANGSWSIRWNNNQKLIKILTYCQLISRSESAGNGKQNDLLVGCQVANVDLVCWRVFEQLDWRNLVAFLMRKSMIKQFNFRIMQIRNRGMADEAFYCLRFSGLSVNKLFAFSFPSRTYAIQLWQLAHEYAPWFGPFLWLISNVRTIAVRVWPKTGLTSRKYSFINEEQKIVYFVLIRNNFSIDVYCERA